MKPLAFAALLLVGCLDVAEDRATAESRVGEASAEGVTIQVDDGLAAVRAIGRDRVTLWASAPRIALALTFAPGPAARFTLAVDNAMPDAIVTGGALAARDLVPETGEASTERRFTFTPPDTGGQLRMQIGPRDADLPGPFQFVAMADVQEAIDRVQDIFTLINREPGVQFVVFNGDLTSFGTEAELERFQREAKNLRVPLFATLGNHELGSGGEVFRRLYGRGSFRFRHRGVQLTMLDSASATIAPTTYRRLQSWLEEGRPRVHIVGMHIPPIDPVGVRNGSFASRAEGARLLAMLADGGVDLTLYGHLHSYYSFINAGVPAYVSGGGGAIPERFDGIGRHFLVVEVDAAVGVRGVRVVRVD